MDPYYQAEAVTLYLGDCIAVMAQMDPESIDAIVCDPPYGLKFMGKDWDTFPVRDRGERLTGQGNPTSARGFAGNVAYSAALGQMRAFQAWCEAWAREAYRVLKPGGHLAAFGGTRTYHRLVSGIEDAGFEIRDTLAWMYGSGFPKSLDVSKAIDRINGKPLDRLRDFGAHVRAAREAAGLTQADVNRAMRMPQGCGWWEGKGAGAKWDIHLPSIETYAALKAVIKMDDTFDWLIEWAEAEREIIGARDSNILAVAPGQGSDRSATTLDITAPATEDAQRWQGWGTALKPAYEPIVLARKPLSGTVAANVLQHGTGALNIDASRIGTEERTNPPAHNVDGSGWGMRPNVPPSVVSGRWPANVILDEEAAAMLDAQTGQSVSIAAERGLHGRHDAGDQSNQRIKDYSGGVRGHNDRGGPSRFFYTAKAPRTEREAGLEDLPGLTPGQMTDRKDGAAGTNNPRAGAGRGQKRHGIEDLTDLRMDHQVNRTMRHNDHPTVKPVAVMRWLVRMVTPPGGVILDPFLGSGTTAMAALDGELFRFVGIDMEEHYVEIAKRRVAHRHLIAPEVKPPAEGRPQGRMF